MPIPASLLEDTINTAAVAVRTPGAWPGNESEAPAWWLAKHQTCSSPLERYECVRDIGAGGTARVQLVRVKGTDVEFAMKQVQVAEGHGGALDLLKVLYVLRELHVLQACGGPPLPRLYDSFYADGTAYLVMTVAQSGDLMTHLSSTANHCFCEATVKQFACHLLEGLERLHKNGIVYVDLKPENLLLQDHDRLVLVDFGLCCVEEEATVTTSASELLFAAEREFRQQNSKAEADEGPRFWGTIEYTAPEVLDGGAAAFSPQSDFWSLGILLYELLYGKTPFRGHNMEQTFYFIQMRGVQFPERPGEAPPVSYDMQQLIRCLTRQKPEYRLGINGIQEIRAHRALRDTSR